MQPLHLYPGLVFEQLAQMRDKIVQVDSVATTKGDITTGKTPLVTAGMMILLNCVCIILYASGPYVIPNIYTLFTRVCNPM